MQPRPKQPEELERQLGNAEGALGTPLASSKRQRAELLEASPELLRERYPLTYEAYRRSLVATRRGTEPPLELHRWVQAINRLEQFVAGEQTEQGFLRTHQLEVFRDLLEFFEEGKKRGYIK